MSGLRQRIGLGAGRRRRRTRLLCPRVDGVALLLHWRRSIHSLTPMRRPHRNRTFLAVIGAALLASGCGGASLWPFDSGGARERSRALANATEFRCEGGKRLFLRTLSQGAATWVILPEREFRLDKTAAAEGAAYSNGTTTLVVREGEATLSEGATALYSGCKSAAPGKDGGA